MGRRMSIGDHLLRPHFPLLAGEPVLVESWAYAGYVPKKKAAFPASTARNAALENPPGSFVTAESARCLRHAEPLVDVGLQHAKDGFMPLDGHRQGAQQTLGREEIDDDPLADLDRFRRNADRLGVQTEVDDQFFGRAGDAAEIRVQGQDVRVVDSQLGLGRTCGGRLGSLVFRNLGRVSLTY